MTCEGGDRPELQAAPGLVRRAWRALGAAVGEERVLLRHVCALHGVVFLICAQKK